MSFERHDLGIRSCVTDVGWDGNHVSIIGVVFVYMGAVRSRGDCDPGIETAAGGPWLLNGVDCAR